MAANPLLLTILASIQRQGVTLPERRVELYETYVKVLLRDWHLARGVDGTPQPASFSEQEALQILRPLALWMQEVAPGRGRVEEGPLQAELRKLFARKADSEDEAETAAARFLERLQDETSLLAAVGVRQYAFLHLTFQEYLAAMALARKGPEALVRALTTHLREPEWREVNLLALAGYALHQEEPEAVIGDLLAWNGEPVGEAVVLAGEALVDVGARTVDRMLRERVVKALLATMRDFARMAAPVRARAGEVLAELGDPRPEVMTLAGMADALCKVPAGAFWIGEEEEKHEVTISYPYRVARFPVTVAQYRE